MEKRHRVFIAINLPNDVKKQLDKYQEKWLELPAKWTDKDNLHITLEFLGDLTDLQIADACKAVAEVSKVHSSFSLNLNKVVYAPPGKIPPKMIWATGEKSEELFKLRKDLEELLSENFKLDNKEKAYSSHVTLARMSAFAFREFEQDEIPEVNEMIDLPFTVESIDVMESELKKTGPVYTILESHTLQN